jgi:hypothetical protein
MKSGFWHSSDKLIAIGRVASLALHGAAPAIAMLLKPHQACSFIEQRMQMAVRPD